MVLRGAGHHFFLLWNKNSPLTLEARTKCVKSKSPSTRDAISSFSWSLLPVGPLPFSLQAYQFENPRATRQLHMKSRYIESSTSFFFFSLFRFQIEKRGSSLSLNQHRKLNLFSFFITPKTRLIRTHFTRLIKIDFGKKGKKKNTARNLSNYSNFTRFILLSSSFW